MMRPLLLAALAILWAQPALACKWYYNEDNKPLHQVKQQVHYYIDATDLDFITAGEEDQIIQAAFGVWNAVDTPLEFVFAGHTDSAEAAFYGDSELDQNHIVFVPFAWTSQVPWQHENAIALTSLGFSKATGEIVDADIRINNQLYYFANCDTAPEEWQDYQDLFYVMLHEAGHVTGLNHSDDELSVMYVQDSSCADEPMHHLTPDDTKCFIDYYGSQEFWDLCCAPVPEPDPELRSDADVPSHDLDTTPETEVVEEASSAPGNGCCQAGPHTDPMVAAWLIGLILLGWSRRKQMMARAD